MSTATRTESPHLRDVLLSRACRPGARPWCHPGPDAVCAVPRDRPEMVWAGVAADSVLLGSGFVHGSLGDGFDLRRHALSQLSPGTWGAAQIGTFLLTDTLVVAVDRGLAVSLGSGSPPGGSGRVRTAFCPTNAGRPRVPLEQDALSRQAPAEGVRPGLRH